MSTSPQKTANGVQVYESPVRRVHKKFNFWRGIYNKDKNYILGRTPRNWGKNMNSFIRKIIIWSRKRAERIKTESFKPIIKKKVLIRGNNFEQKKETFE